MSKKLIFVMLLITIITSGCKTNTKVENLIDTSTFYFFYPDTQAMYWLIEEVELENNLEKVILELIKSDKNLISSDVKLISCKVENKIAYLDLSSNFEDFSKGDLVMIVNITTIANTLCNNKFSIGEIDAISFLLDGKATSFEGSLLFYPTAKLLDLYESTYDH